MADVLIDLLLRVVALLVIAAVVVQVMRRSSASLRALMWTAALTGALVLPLISLVAPPLEIAVLPMERAIDTPALTTAMSNTAPAAVSTPASVERASTEHAATRRTTPIADNTLATQQYEPIPHVAQEPASHDAAAGMPTWFTSHMSTTTLLSAVWMIGALLLLVRLASSHRRLGELVSSSSSASDDWTATVDAVRAELGIRRRVRVRVSHDIDIPAVAGVITPVLLLPASNDWSANERRDVVVHELAHVARWDALAQLLSNVASAIYWFIPLTWYAARHAAALREQACDNVVLRAGTRPSLYARRLLTFAHAPMSTALEPVALAMARRSHITRRVREILDPNTRRTRLSVSFTTAFIAMSLAMVAFVAIVEPVSASEPLEMSPAEFAQMPASASAPVIANASVLPSAGVLSAPESVVSEAAVDATTSSASTAALSDVLAPPTEPSLLAPPVTTDEPKAADTPLSIPIAMLPTIAVADAPAVVKTSAPLQTFVICRNGTKNTSITSNDGGDSRTWRLTASGPGCDISIRIEGKPTFNREFTDVVRISGRGLFDLDIREDGVRRELRIRDDNGRITRTWRIDGRERPYDADAAAWFAQALVALDRKTAFAVDVRLPLLLEQGGVQAVLTETGLMPSDYARSTYYKALSKARRLSSQELLAVLDQGAQLNTSDYYSAELLKGVAAQDLGDPAVRDGVMRLISRITSDYYRHESIKATVNAGRPTSGELGLLIQVVGTMKSDYYRAETIKALTRTAELSSAQLNDVLSIASKMSNDHHISEMLGSLLSRGSLDADKRLAYLTAARAIKGDYHRAEALGALLKNGPPTNGEMDLVFTVISGIDSDHHMGVVLDRLLAFRSLREADLLRAESVARAIRSDHTHSEMLRRIGSHASATEAVRSAVHATALSLSRHYREQVQRGVER